MAGILGRRARLLMLAGAVALVATGCVAEVTFSGTKEVTGEPSTGPFVASITCPGAVPETQELTFAGPGTDTTSAFIISDETTCTITEIEQAGAATVTYACDDVEIILTGESFDGGGPGMSVAGGPIEDDVTCTEGDEDITVDVNAPVLATVSFTVTNDFPAATTTTTTAPPVADPAVALPARGQPTFTG